jgi:hypothetical protein
MYHTQGKAIISDMRRTTVGLLALQIVIPAVMLVARIDDPTRGQMPFGWQMHTACWGDNYPC